MYNGDQARKKVLIEHGFRLPSAADNPPQGRGVLGKGTQVYCFCRGLGVRNLRGRIVEQVIRPTGVVDPEIFVRPTDGQIDDLLGEIKDRVDRRERVLVTTLTNAWRKI